MNKHRFDDAAAAVDDRGGAVWRFARCSGLKVVSVAEADIASPVSSLGCR